MPSLIKKDFLQLIAAGESDVLELKQSFNKEAIQTISAFANTKGGTLLIGINASNEIVGIQFGEETIQNYMNQIKQATSPSIFPDIETIEINGKWILVISVDEFPVKPISYKDRYYKRVQNSNHVMNLAEISNMHLQSLQLSWDAYEYPNGSLKDIDMVKNKVTKYTRTWSAAMIYCRHYALGTLKEAGMTPKLPGKDDPMVLGEHSLFGNVSFKISLISFRSTFLINIYVRDFFKI